jgi:uncharacterized protein (TIGR03546 family)
MLLRHIGRMVRGQATPAQVMMGALLGALFGFVPGFSVAPGLCVALGALVLLLNVSLPFVLLVFAPCKLLGLLALPVSFHIGRALVDGPLQGLFRWLVNTPVLALFGFERYVTSGGLLLGLVVGGLVGWLCNRTIARMRAKLANIDVASETYNKVAGKPVVRLLGWALLGTRDLRWSKETRSARPVRVAGLVVVVLLFGLAAALHAALTGPLLTRVVRSGLESANGATVDLQRAELDIPAGRLTIEGLAMADPQALDHDIFRAGRIQCDVDTADLLRRRIALDAVVVSEASQGAPRATPGQRTKAAPEPPPADTSGGGKTLDEWVRDAKAWKERLAQVRRWLDAVSSESEKKPEAKGAPGEAAPAGPTLEERMEAQAARDGWASVTAEHLIEGAPTFLVRKLVIEGLSCASLPGDLLDVNGVNLSSQPALVAEPASLHVLARSGVLEARVGLGGAGASTEKGALLFHLKDWPVDSFASSLGKGGEPPLAGGTLDLLLDGGWAGGQVGQLDLPLKITLKDSTLHIGGHEQKVSKFKLELALKGPIDNPAVTLDDDGLAEALKAAGAAELSKKVDEQKAKAEDKVKDALNDKLGGLLGGDDKPKKKKKDG